VAQAASHEDAVVSRHVRAFMISRPRWYTQVLLLNAIDMRALHAAYATVATVDPSFHTCSLKRMEAILRLQGICFQAGHQPNK
jgi:hypothetical protein